MMLRNKISYLVLVACALFSFLAYSAEHTMLPPKHIDYLCACKVPTSQGLCHTYESRTDKESSDTSPKIKRLRGGWVLQLVSCQNKQKYHLTAGSVLFAGKKIRALYDRLKTPLASSGYVYHVTPSLPNTKRNYSSAVVTHPHITGIVLSGKRQGWRCGIGNRQTSCYGKFHNARCYVGSLCHFKYSPSGKP